MIKTWFSPRPLWVWFVFIPVEIASALHWYDIERNGIVNRGGSRTAATSKNEHFVLIVSDFQPLTIIKKCSILDFAAVLDPPLVKTRQKAIVITQLRVASLTNIMKIQCHSRDRRFYEKNTHPYTVTCFCNMFPYTLISF